MASSSSSNSRTSKLAEDVFGALCSNSDVVRNKVEDDQKGWDFFVQYPAEPSDLPADLRPPERECLVQVKSRRKAVRSWKLKLTNALRYANSDLPCFVVLFIFDRGTLLPKTVYAQHFWSDQIRGALATARQAHLDGKAELHKIDFEITFSDADRCEASELVDKIADIIDGVGAAYPAEKRNLRKTAGYEDVAAVGNFTLKVDRNSEDYVDMLLGRRPASVSDFEIRDRRFGLEGPVLATMGPGEITFTPEPTGECQVVIGQRLSGADIALSGKIYTVPLENIPPERRKARVAAGPLELILRYAGHQEAHIDCDMSEPLDMQAALNAASLLSWGGVDPLQVAVWVDGRCLVQGRLTLTETNGAGYWRRLRQVIQRLLTFMPAERWQPQGHFSLLDMMQGLDGLAKFAGLVSGGVTVGYEGVPPEDFSLLETMTDYLGCHWVEMDHVSALAVIAAPIEVASRPGGADVRLGVSELIHRAVLVGPVDQHRTYIEKIWRDACDGLGNDHTLFCEPDFKAFAALKARAEAEVEANRSEVNPSDSAPLP